LPIETQEVIDWARKKMQEEKKLNKLCEKHPSLKNARDKFETIKALVEND